MPTPYVFHLTKSGQKIITLKLNNYPGEFADDWQDVSSDPDNCMVQASGAVRTGADRLQCVAGGMDQAVLLGASWDSLVGAAGDATIEAASGCPANGWSWNLKSIG